MKTLFTVCYAFRRVAILDGSRYLPTLHPSVPRSEGRYGMARQAVETLRDGDALSEVFLAVDKQLRANRNGVTYIQLDLRDRTGGIAARLWNAGDAQFRGFENGDFVRAEGKVQNFQGALQVILTGLEKADAGRIDAAEFLPRTEQDPAKLFERLRGLLLKLNEPNLRALGDVFLMDDELMKAFCACPAGVKLHHAYIGGLLEHSVTMMELAERMIPFYPGTDRDLLLIGAFLHDLGKTRELSYARAFGYTDEGQLLGHIHLGIELLNERIPKVVELTGEPFPRELLVKLKHLILSHHGSLEHGSPKVPMTPEAMLLHSIDLLDTRMHMVLRELKEDRNNPTAWTPYNPTLQRRIYKGGPNGELFSSGNGEGYD